MDSNVVIPAVISGFSVMLTAVMVFLGIRYSENAKREESNEVREMTVSDKARDAELQSMMQWRQEQALAFQAMKVERDAAYSDRLDANNERRTVMARIEDAEHKYDVLEGSVAEVKRENTEIKRENMDMKERVKSLERQLLNAHNQIDKLRKDGNNGSHS